MATRARREPAQQLPCPDCAEPLPAAAHACPACGLGLTGAAAGRLWQVDQQLLALQSERSHLVAELRRGAADGTPSVGSTPVAPVRAGGRSAQQLLLLTGVVLVLVAGAVFLAVAWERFGILGQIAVMLTAAVAAGVTAWRLALRGLRATAEWVAVAATGLLAVDLAAAHWLDLAGLGAVPESTYLAFALALGSVVLASAGVVVRQLWTFGAAAVAAAALVPLAALEAAEEAPWVTAVVVLGGAAGLLALSDRLPRHRPAGRAAQTTATWFGAGQLVAGALFAVEAVFDPSAGTAAGGPVRLPVALGSALIAVALLGWRALRDRPAAGSDDGALSTRTALYGGGAVLTLAWTAAGLAWHGGAGAVTGLGVVAAGCAAAAATPRIPFPRSSRLSVAPRLLAVLVGHTTAAAAVLLLVLSDPAGGDRLGHPGWAGLVLAAISGAVAVGLTTPGRGDVAGAAYVALTAVAASGFATADLGPWVQAASIAVASAAVARGAARGASSSLESSLEREVALGAVAVLGFLGSMMVGVEAGHARAQATTLAVAGLTALAYSATAGRGLAAYAGVVSCAAATWVLFADRGVELVEAYSLPLAALAAAVGAVVLRRRRSAASWEVAGPALSAALLPSALATLDDPALIRPLVVVAAGVVAVALGLHHRWQSPILIGSVALLVVAFSQLAPYAVGVPRWVTLGTAGVVLLVLGARYEQARRSAGDALRWLVSLR